MTLFYLALVVFSTYESFSVINRVNTVTSSLVPGNSTNDRQVISFVSNNRWRNSFTKYIILKNFNLSISPKTYTRIYSSKINTNPRLIVSFVLWLILLYRLIYLFVDRVVKLILSICSYLSTTSKHLLKKLFILFER